MTRRGPRHRARSSSSSAADPSRFRSRRVPSRARRCDCSRPFSRGLPPTPLLGQFRRRFLLALESCSGTRSTTTDGVVARSPCGPRAGGRVWTKGPEQFASIARQVWLHCTGGATGNPAPRVDVRSGRRLSAARVAVRSDCAVRALAVETPARADIDGRPVGSETTGRWIDDPVTGLCGRDPEGRWQRVCPREPPTSHPFLFARPSVGENDRSTVTRQRRRRWW